MAECSLAHKALWDWEAWLLSLSVFFFFDIPVNILLLLSEIKWCYIVILR